MSKKTTKQLDHLIQKAKESFVGKKEPYCESCGRNDRRLSVSHTLSVKRCKDIGKPELAYDEDNFVFECCCGSDSCHYIWESAPMDKKLKLKTVNKKLKYMKKNDKERFISFLYAADSVKPGFKDKYLR